MVEQTSFIPDKSLYDILKEKGVDLSWYEKNRHHHDNKIPLEDDECSKLSVYLLRSDGSLWTVDSDGIKYHKVRDYIKKVASSVYVCVHCRMTWYTYEDAIKHC